MALWKGMFPWGDYSGEYAHSHSKQRLIFELQLTRCQSQVKPSLTEQASLPSSWIPLSHSTERCTEQTEDLTFSFPPPWPQKQWDTIELNRRAYILFPLRFILSSELCIHILITNIYLIHIRICHIEVWNKVLIRYQNLWAQEEPTERRRYMNQ